MINNRNELKTYALSICLRQLEKAAADHENGAIPTVIDHVGYIPTFLEEWCRPFWGLAPILNEEPDITLSFNGKNVLLVDWLETVLYEGLAEDSPRSWERYRYTGAGWGLDFQNLTELAGLLIGFCFSREKTWDRFTKEHQNLFADRIFSFCRGQCEHMAGNNHIWFPVFCVLALKKLGYTYPETDRYLRSGLEKLERLYLGCGWYSDGEFGRFDYYEAWSLHTYPLLWCLLEDESFAGYADYRARYLERCGAFLSQYAYFFDEDGAFPPMGRSLSYRFAAVSVFPLAIMAGCQFDPGLARRITLKNIGYFQENVRKVNGILPPGYLYDAPALVENYTSDGGAYWCAKAFLCLLMKEDAPFWTAPDMPMPSETDAYRLIPAQENVLLTIAAAKDQGVTLYNNVAQYYQHDTYCNPFNDMAGYYCKFAYNSIAGFALSSRDNTSFDGMISLETADRSMASHRWGFVDEHRENEWLISVHHPFSNDAETVIETTILPFSGSVHVRLHKVTLSQPYRVREGGYPLPLWCDYHTEKRTENGFALENGTLYSGLTAVSTVPMGFGERKMQPGMYLMAPQGCYPAYETDVLPAGTYWFASAYAIGKKEIELPELILTETSLKIRYQENTIQIPLK